MSLDEFFFCLKSDVVWLVFICPYLYEDTLYNRQRKWVEITAKTIFINKTDLEKKNAKPSISFLLLQRT